MCAHTRVSTAFAGAYSLTSYHSHTDTWYALGTRDKAPLQTDLSRR